MIYTHPVIIRFEWDKKKSEENKIKHGISFDEVPEVFIDEKKIILKDRKHSYKEDRLYCIGRCKLGIVTVRFTYRDNVIRIFGAGNWRQGKKSYEKKNKDSAI